MPFSPYTPEELIRRTVWLLQRGKHDWVAINHKGDVVAQAKFQSTLAYTLRCDIGRGKFVVPNMDECWAIAKVVLPSARQPDKARRRAHRTRLITKGQHL